MKLLLSYSKKFSILIRFYNGLSILGWAIQCLAIRCVTYLIDHNIVCTSCCGIDEIQTTKTTPLMVTLRQPTMTRKGQENKLKLIQFLSNHKTSAQLPFDEPILHVAVHDTDPRILEVLLESRHVTPNGTDHEHCTPIVRAVWSTGNTTLNTLLRCPTIRISHNYTLEEFRDKEMRPMQSPLLWDPLLQAVQERRPDKVQRLLAAGADPNMVAGWDRFSCRQLSAYQLSMMTVGHSNRVYSMGKALQVLKILRTAGARPTISVFYHEFLLQLKMKNPTLRKQRDKILKNAMQEATQVLSLKGLSRASIVGQLRKNTDGHSIYGAMENLLQSERLPRELERFLKFENVLDRPAWFLPPPIH